MRGLIVAATVVALLLLSAVLSYNRLIQGRNAVGNAWAQVDVQLRRRYDLVPNLVETVSGYARHERAAFEAVVRARAASLAAATPAERSEAEGLLSSGLRGLLAVAEDYPELRADRQFVALQEELVITENRVAYARQYYNDAVFAYRNAIEAVPGNLIAAALRMRAEDYFQAAEDQREPRQAGFG